MAEFGYLGLCPKGSPPFLKQHRLNSGLGETHLEVGQVVKTHLEVGQIRVG